MRATPWPPSAMQMRSSPPLVTKYLKAQDDFVTTLEKRRDVIRAEATQRRIEYAITGKAFKLAGNERARFTAYLLSLPQESQIANLVSRITELIGNMYPITDPEVKEYVRRIVVGMSAEQMRDCIERDVAYVRKIKKKISALADVHAVKAFTDLLDVDRIVLQPGFKLSESITPSANASAIPKSLYVTEAAMGDFERRLINDIANLESVQWWHRNLSRGKGFRINGFLNHYPDCIVKTKAGKIIALDTKGDGRDNSDSELKLNLTVSQT